MMHGLAISLPESALVQSPLRLSACAYTHMHTQMRESSDARLAATRGAGRCSGRTQYQHGCRSYWLTRATREVGSDSDFQVWGSSDDIALTSPTRGTRGRLSHGACVHLLHRVPSHRSSGLLLSQCQGSRFVARGGRARSGACMHTACDTCSTFTGKPPHCPWKQSCEKKNLGPTASSLRWRDESCS
jgi:hypothetical protein